MMQRAVTCMHGGQTAWKPTCQCSSKKVTCTSEEDWVTVRQINNHLAADGHQPVQEGEIVFGIQKLVFCRQEQQRLLWWNGATTAIAAANLFPQLECAVPRLHLDDLHTTVSLCCRRTGMAPRFLVILHKSMFRYLYPWHSWPVAESATFSPLLPSLQPSCAFMPIDAACHVDAWCATRLQLAHMAA